jgi:hypothetical protein
MAGISNGTVTLEKVIQLDAPATLEASSKLASIALNAPTTMRKIVVTPLRPSRKTMPQRL